MHIKQLIPRCTKFEVLLMSRAVVVRLRLVVVTVVVNFWCVVTRKMIIEFRDCSSDEKLLNMVKVGDGLVVVTVVMKL